MEGSLMPADKAYGDYIASDEYHQYYQKYFHQMRESDRVLIELIRSAFKDELARSASLSLVDIGCGSGNLLFHIKNQFATLALTGGDTYSDVIEGCRKNSDLEDITFEVMDLLKLNQASRFDGIIVNAVLFLFNATEFDLAVSNIACALKPGGWFFAYDFATHYQQDLTILEKSVTHPDGMTLHFRPAELITEIMQKHGFTKIVLSPFQIPIDLAPPGRPEDISSRTVMTDVGERLIFRGSLFTPWCHMMAQKNA